MKKCLNHKGITLVELSVGAVVVGLLIVALMNFFSFGLSGSRRGMESLTNMGEASILMSQIELDLMRARRMLEPSSGDSATAAKWEVGLSTTGATGIVSYRMTDKGIERTEQSGAEMEQFLFCRGRKVTLSFDHLILKDLPEKIDKTAVLVAVFVGNSPDDKRSSEEFRLIRLITCNHRQLTTEL